MIDDEALTPLLQARSRIDLAIEAMRNKLAGLSKKRDAINTAIGVLQQSDEDLGPLPTKGTQSERVVVFDEEAVEQAVLSMFNGKPLQARYIREQLGALNIPFSLAGLYRILKTSPLIRREGVRDQTRYLKVEKGGAG